jgi:hypothetical protein
MVTSENQNDKSQKWHKKLLAGLYDFCAGVWVEAEPIIIELFTYLIIIFFVAFVALLTESFVPEKIKETLNYIKYFLLISVIGLFSIRTIIVVIIRALGTLNKERKKTFTPEKVDDLNEKKLSEISDGIKHLTSTLQPVNLDEMIRSKDRLSEINDGIKHLTSTLQPASFVEMIRSKDGKERNPVNRVRKYKKRVRR